MSSPATAGDPVNTDRGLARGGLLPCSTHGTELLTTLYATPKAVLEVWRVLRAGGVAKIMIYHKWSLVGYMLWLRYALLGFRPWRTLKDVYSKYLESPGTKAYTVAEARRMFSAFKSAEIRITLTHGDLLESAAGQRHQGSLLSVARLIWPRTLLKKWAKGHGLFMMIQAIK